MMTTTPTKQVFFKSLQDNPPLIRPKWIVPVGPGLFRADLPEKVDEAGFSKAMQTLKWKIQIVDQPLNKGNSQ